MPIFSTPDEVALAYDDIGSGAQTVVLMHGMACRRTQMAGLADHLASRFRCINVDLRGHGDSGKPRTGYAMADFHGDLRGLLDRLGVVQPILIGHSFGGSISLAYAHDNPGAVRGLVMLDSGMRTNAHLQADLGPFYDALRSGDEARYKAVLREFVAARLVDPVDGAAFAAEVADLMVSVPDYVFLSMSDTVRTLRSAEMAAAYRGDALLLLSRQAFVETAAVERLGPNWHVGRVVGAGHFIQLVAPLQVTAMIDRFLELTLDM